MSIEQIIVLALVQGITEFLPISSSGHLILVPALTGWPDQGLGTDVMVHIGTLAAILVYFWRDVLALARGTLNLLRLKMTDDGRMALYIVAATIPAVLFGLVLTSTGLVDRFRSVALIGWNAIIFGALLLAADRFAPRLNSLRELTLAPAVLIGVAQALALIPGTSRSGITITAARFLGLNRVDAARFSFLLGIPAMVGAGLLTAVEARNAGHPVSGDAVLAALFSFVFGIAAIAFLMAVVRRMSFLPFVLYRFALGAVLLGMAYA